MQAPLLMPSEIQDLANSLCEKWTFGCSFQFIYFKQSKFSL